MADDGPKIPGAIVTVLGWFTDALEWMVDTFDDPALSKAIRVDVGLDPDDTTPPPIDDARLQGVRAFTESVDPTAESFAQVVEDVVAIAEAIGGWVQAAQTDDQPVDEIVYLLLVMGATESVRVRSPLAHALTETTVTAWDVFSAVPGVDESALIAALEPLADLLRLVFSLTTRTELPKPDLDERYADQITHLATISTVLAIEGVGLGDRVTAFAGWDHPVPGSLSPVADELSQRLLTLVVGDPDDGAGVSTSVTMALVPIEHGGPGIIVSLGGEAHITHLVARPSPEPPEHGQPVPGWAYRIEVGGGGLGLFIPFGGDAELATGADLSAAVSLGVSPVLIEPADDPSDPPEPRPAPRTVPAFRIGFISDSLIEIGSFGGGFEFGPGRARAELLLRDIDLVLELGQADQFLATQDDRKVLFGFDLRIIADTATGLSFGGGSGFHVAIPVSRSLFGVFVAHHVEVEILPSAERDVALLVTGTFGLRLGPFQVVVQRTGVLLDLAFGVGALGLVDADFGFQPPRGVGLSLEVGNLKGGGFLFHDPNRREYAGVLEVVWGPITFKAIAIITTELPDNARGWSLLVVLFGEFEPQPIGLGFFLAGLGGLVGVQHGVDTQVLRDGLRTGVLDSVMFPNDPVANAPRLLNQFRAVFPITPRALTFGPFLLLTYSRPPLIRIRLGLVFQLDGAFRSSNRDVELTRMVIVGQLVVELPPKEVRPSDAPVLVKLTVDLLGDIDFEAGSLAIDARLRDSKIAGLTLTGTLVVRARWRGSNRTWLAAAGGFHPEFDDLPEGLPKQQRLAQSLKKGIATVKFESYLALTSNSIQFGARVFAQAKKWGFTVEGWLGFDTLVELAPPRFRVDIEAGVSLKKGSRTLMGVDLKLTVMGPGRWNLAGSAKFKVLFVKKTIRFDESWGSDPELPPVTIDALGAVERALADPSAWSGALPDGDEMLVSLRRSADVGGVRAHPLGTLTVVQRVVPFGIDVDLVGGATPTGARRFAITDVDVNGVSGADLPTRPVREHFATGQFLELSDDQRLALPSFEQHDAGVEIGADEIDLPSHLSVELDVETVRIPRPPEPVPRPTSPLPIAVVIVQAQIGASARSPLRKRRSIRDAPVIPVKVRAPKTVAVLGGDLTPAGADRDAIAVEEWEVARA